MIRSNNNSCLSAFKNVLIYKFITAFLIIFPAHVWAQDSLSNKVINTSPILTQQENQSQADSARMAYIAKRFNPQKALLYAAILPGAGQVYNKKYWKVPLVYGGFVFLGYYIDLYNDNYRFYRGELFQLLNKQPTVSGLPESSLRSITDRYRRERDFFIILSGLWYALQIIDAHVDSHLKEFDINPNLQVRVEPSFKQDMLLGRQSGFTVSIRF
ncbi:MAG: hypothetical protein EBR30_24930 [Cytophagia bacterium]|nr:hypothetical protein [Cytophagia bacterium]NBW38206.1 hypothetical protein [Cytophagia bacterium]